MIRFRFVETIDDADQDDEDYCAERHPNWHLVDVTQYHLRPDEDEHEAEPVLQVVEAVNQVGEDEVEATESKNRHDVRVKDDIRVTRVGKACRDRVDGEDDIRQLDKDERDEERREEQFAVDALRELTGRDVLRDRQAALEPTDRLVLFERLVLADIFEHHPSRIDEEGTEHVIDPTEVFQE